MRAEDAGLPRDDVGPARHGMDHGDAVLADELQERLVRIEAVHDAQVGLVRIAHLVLILIRLLEVERPGQPDHRMGVDQARRHHGGGHDRIAFRQWNVLAFADLGDLAVLDQDDAVLDRALADGVNAPGQHRELLRHIGDARRVLRDRPAAFSLRRRALIAAACFGSNFSFFASAKPPA